MDTERGNFGGGVENVYVGLPPKSREEQRRIAHEAGEILSAQARERWSREQEVQNKYGEKLVKFGVAYASRLKPGNNGFVSVDVGKWVRVDEAREGFVQELVTAMGNQPDEDKVSWLTSFLKEVDTLAR